MHPTPLIGQLNRAPQRLLDHKSRLITTLHTDEPGPCKETNVSCTQQRNDYPPPVWLSQSMAHIYLPHTLIKCVTRLCQKACTLLRGCCHTHMPSASLHHSLGSQGVGMVEALCQACAQACTYCRCHRRLAPAHCHSWNKDSCKGPRCKGPWCEVMAVSRGAALCHDRHPMYLVHVWRTRPEGCDRYMLTSISPVQDGAPCLYVPRNSSRSPMRQSLGALKPC